MCAWDHICCVPLYNWFQIKSRFLCRKQFYYNYTVLLYHYYRIIILLLKHFIELYYFCFVVIFVFHDGLAKCLYLFKTVLIYFTKYCCQKKKTACHRVNSDLPARAEYLARRRERLAVNTTCPTFTLTFHMFISSMMIVKFHEMFVHKAMNVQFT